MSMSTYANHVADVSSGSTPVLGQLTWYSIPTDTVDHDSVLKACRNHGIASYAPAIPRPPDVFRRACKSSARRIGGKEDPQRFSYEFKSIDKDDQSINMKLVREVVDAQTNTGIDWARLANVTFQRDTHRIDVTPLPDLDDEGKEVIANLRATFDAENGKVNDAHLRRMIQDVLHDCLATAVRPSGGIYFVTKDNESKLRKLSAVIAEIPHSSSMHLLPLVDTSDQRAMLQAAVEKEMISEFDNQMGKVVEILKSGKKITSDKYGNLVKELHRTGRKGAEYATLLDDKLTDFEDRKNAANAMIRKLSDLVEDK